MLVLGPTRHGDAWGLSSLHECHRLRQCCCQGPAAADAALPQAGMLWHIMPVVLVIRTGCFPAKLRTGCFPAAHVPCIMWHCIGRK